MLNAILMRHLVQNTLKPIRAIMTLQSARSTFMTPQSHFAWHQKLFSTNSSSLYSSPSSHSSSSFKHAPHPARKRYQPSPVKRFYTVPEEMARVQNGLEVKLRDYSTQKFRGSFSFDLTVQSDGLVHPFEGTHYEYPNGCSLRPPFSRVFQEIVRGFDPEHAYVFIIPAETKLPDNIVMLHEHSDHYALQCTQPMPLDKLDSILTTFFNEKCECFTLQEFFDEFPFE